jgi:hypothetical protein
MNNFFAAQAIAFLLVLLNVVNGELSAAQTKEHGKRLNPDKSTKTDGIHSPFWVPNRIGTYLSNNGYMVIHHATGSAGMEWPVGSGNSINYASGLWLVGKKDGEIVSAVAEFSNEFQPGNVTDWAPGIAGIPADPNDERFRVYMIDRKDLADPFANPDYANWPVADGAPVDDEGNPLLLGTSTAWPVFNDFDQILHDRLFQSGIMGVEVQMTAWAFDRPNALGDMMFFKFKIINKSGENLASLHTAFWADIDIGDGVDLVGCDTTLSLGYSYKTQEDGVYGANPPAIGYDLLQGPIIPSTGDTAFVSGRIFPDFKNLPMTTFFKFI